MHLVNSKELIDPRTFVKAKIDDFVEVGTTIIPITRRGTRMIRNIVNSDQGPRTQDLILYDIVVVEGFYVNIVSKARLAKKDTWYYGYDLTIRLGIKEKNIILI
jgi:hypothetical protein